MHFLQLRYQSPKSPFVFFLDSADSCLHRTGLSHTMGPKYLWSWIQKFISCSFCVHHDILKVAFFQKVRFVFQISQSPKKIIPKNYPELEIPAHISKQLIQIEIEKQISLSEKNTPLKLNQCECEFECHTFRMYIIVLQLIWIFKNGKVKITKLRQM